MKIWDLLANHSHYFGVPHRNPADCRLIQICYECGKQREVRVDVLQLRETPAVLTDGVVFVPRDESPSSEMGFHPFRRACAGLRFVLNGVSLVLRK